MKAQDMTIGLGYRFKNQPERLIYIGMGNDGSFGWYQFERQSKPGKVWNELLDTDLHMIEKVFSDSVNLEDKS